MKFNDYKYVRPDLDLFKQQMEDLLDTLSGEITLNEEIEVINEVFALQDEMDTMNQLVGIRHSVDTKDEFYDKEQEFFDQNGPIIQEFEQMFIDKLLSSNNKKGLLDKLGNLLFEQAELQKKTFTPEIIPDLQLENKLSS